jgi:hypothetical protein
MLYSDYIRGVIERKIAIPVRTTPPPEEPECWEARVAERPDRVKGMRRNRTPHPSPQEENEDNVG